MPLKHFTETVLIVLLGCMTLVTGVAMDTLPLLPEGALPWAIAFAITLLYGLSFYPMLKQNRADNSFRILHFLPAAMLVLWLVIELLTLKFPQALTVHHWYTWGWSVVVVVLCFLLFIGFCLNVIRRRVPRIALLLLLLVPFTGLAFASEQYYHWDQKVSSLVWQGNWWDLVGTGTIVAGGQKVIDDTNLDSSDNPQEEAWRRRLRALDERRRSIAEEKEGKSSSSKVSSKASSKALVVSSSSRVASSVQSSGQKSSGREIAQVKTPPPRLPTSGGEMSGLVFAILAGYTSVLHSRAQRRRS